MPNPYHDAEGKFTSKEGMQAAAHALISEGKFHEAIQLLTEYESLTGTPPQNTPIREVLPTGEVQYKVKGNLHREDGPAVIRPHGSQLWYRDGKRHREDGPAVTYSDGSEEWWLNGKLHREDGPAVTYSDGQQEWYRNGKLHREDGPAVTYSDGSEEWWLNGENRGTLPVVPLNEAQEKALSRLLNEDATSDTILLGDLARDVCGMQSQYIAYYVEGYRVDDQSPVLSKGLTITGIERGDYHSFRIQKTDALLFAQRVLAYRSNR